MKRRICIILSIALLLSVFSGINIFAATSRTKADAVNWLNQRIGAVAADMDGMHGAQCVDFIQEYYQFLGVSGGGGDARDYATNTLPSGFQRIKDYYMFVPEAGDIAVWTTGYNGNWYGHVGVVVAADLYTVTVADVYGSVNENPRVVHKTTYKYNGNNMVFWGVIRPDFASKPAPSVSYAQITAGDYLLKCGDRYLNTPDDWDGGNANAQSKNGAACQEFNISKSGNGYCIKSLNGASRVLNVYTEASSQAGANVTLYTKTNHATQLWLFEKKGTSYLIHPSDNPNVALTVQNDGNVNLANSTGASNQLWELLEKEEALPSPPPVVTEQPSVPLPFTDISSYWAKDYVEWAYELGLLNGVSPTSFGPDRIMNRGMLTTALHRLFLLDGRFLQSPGTSNPFTDVPSGAYYEKAVIWASYHGIVTGTGNNRFSPNSGVTREQLATMLYRCAEYAGEPPTVAKKSLSDFKDANKISRYAKEAMAWAVEMEIFTGSGNGLLNPGKYATRAEVAAILARLCR